MTIRPPAPGEPRRPSGPRDPGDAWVEAPTGERYWGRFGAAGLLAVDAERGVLLQHRVSWSHFGDTWALPGGARHQGESALDGAVREAREEAGVPDAATRPRLMSVLDLGYWSYATLVADVVRPFEPTISDPESRALAWVPPGEVAGLPLHPGFAAAWERLRALLPLRPIVIVDAANVVGSVPDGWWRDRAGAARSLVARLAALASRGVPGEALGLAEATWFPEWRIVLEGAARDADTDALAPAPAASGAAAPVFEVVRAAASGDDTVAALAADLAADARVTVATSDRGLAARVGEVGGSVVGARRLLDLLDASG